MEQIISNPVVLQVVIVALVVAAGLIGYVLQNKSKMITIVQGLMLQAEKAADKFVLTNGPTTFNFVVSQAYPLLPPIFRVFFTFDAFKRYAQKLYDLGVLYFEKGIAQSPPNVPTVTPAVIPEPEPVQPTPEPAPTPVPTPVAPVDPTPVTPAQ